MRQRAPYPWWSFVTPWLIVAAVLLGAAALATVPTATSRVEYAGNGATTSFPVTFPYLAKSEVQVYEITAGVATLKTLTTHYTLSAPNGVSGTVVMVTAPATGTTLRIERSAPFVQATNLRTQGDYSAGTLENMADRLTYQTQQLDRRMATIEDGGAGVSSITAGNGITKTGANATPTLTCTTANATTLGCVDTGGQTFAGVKTFSGNVNANGTLESKGGHATDLQLGVYSDGSYFRRIWDLNGNIDYVSTAADGNTGHRVGVMTNWTNLAGKVMEWGVNYGATGSTYSSKANMNPMGYLTSKTPHVLIAAYPNAAVVAGTTYAGVRLPVGRSEDFTVEQITFRISAAGSGGSTNATIRVSDGTNNCDAVVACNTAAGVQTLAPTGACAFLTNASLTLQVTSIGNCTTGPTVQNLNVVGVWQ